MVDVITLALLKKYAESYGGSGSITPEEIQDAVNKYFEEHPIQSTPIDDTLTQEGYAADAKAVGDAIKDIEDELSESGYIREDELKSISEEDIVSLF